MNDDLTKIADTKAFSYGGVLELDTRSVSGNTNQVSPLPTVSSRSMDYSPGIPENGFQSNGQCNVEPAEFETVVSRTKGKGLSTISGVFAPVTISMFSALLFLRMGFATGQLGFLFTVIELVLAYSIILLTVLSLCAVSSNGAVEGGGVYYMISRTLGPEFGGGIGVLFFVANVFSCALYISGFVEAITNLLGFGTGFGGKFIHCVFVSIVILCLCLLGSGMFAKTAVGALAVIFVAYASFVFTVFIKGYSEITIPKENTYAYMVLSNASDQNSEKIIDFNQTMTVPYTGFSFTTFKSNFFTNYTYDYTTGKSTDFAFMFAIIFSGVTGSSKMKLRSRKPVLYKEASDSEESDNDVQASTQQKVLRDVSYSNGSDDEDSSDGDDEGPKRVVRAQKDKVYAELKEKIRLVQNAQNIKDMSKLLTCLESLGKAYEKARTIIARENLTTPRFYIRYLAEFEDFVNEQWEDFDARKNKKGLSVLRQKLRKHNKDFETEIQKYREDPDPVGYSSGKAGDDEVKTYDEATLKPYGYHQLNTLCRANYIDEGLKMPKRFGKEAKLRELLIGKPVKSLEAAWKQFEDYKKERSKRSLAKQIADNKFNKKDSKESIYIQSLKKTLKKTTGRSAAEIQKKLFNSFKSTIGSGKRQIEWKILAWELVDTYNYKSFIALNSSQLKIFWSLVEAFVLMVEKRGFDCLWNASIYYALGVQGWFKTLLWLSNVEKSGNNGCLVRSNAKKYPNIEINVGTVDGKKKVYFYGSVFASMLNPNVYKSKDKDIYGITMTASHSCNNPQCVNHLHIKRELHHKNRANSNIIHGSYKPKSSPTIQNVNRLAPLAEESDGEELDVTGLEEEIIKFVMTRENVSRKKAIFVLKNLIFYKK